MNQAGLLLLFLAGAMNGSFTIPMKFTRTWAWENTWSAWAFFALIVGPFVLTFYTIPELGAVYAQAGLWTVLTVASYGLGWGIGVILLGLAVEAVGTALAFSIILGICAVMGSLVPMFRLHSEELKTARGLALLASLALVLIGVAICALAGRKRESILKLGPSGHSSFAKGLVLCVLSGAGSSFLNFGLAFDQPIVQAAQDHGAKILWSANAALLPVLIAGAIPNLVYCIYLMRRNNTVARFGASSGGHYWLLVILMAIFWFGSVTLYGVSTNMLSSMSTVLAWPLFMSLILITAAVWGVLTGEWKNTGTKPLAIMGAGIGVLIVAIFAFSLLSRGA